MANRYLLGFDVGSSSVKASLVNADSGKCVASAFYPEKEAPIMAVKAGWAEQDPQMWWENAKLSLKKIMADSGAKAEEIKAVGISYQMHGLQQSSGATPVRFLMVRRLSRTWGLTSVWGIC